MSKQDNFQVFSESEFISSQPAMTFKRAFFTYPPQIKRFVLLDLRRERVVPALVNLCLFLNGCAKRADPEKNDFSTRFL